MSVHFQPELYSTITPFLMLSDVSELIDFIKQAFSGEELQRATTPDGTIMHAEVRIGDSVIMMGEVSPEKPQLPAGLYVYFEDVDATFARAVELGATPLGAPEDQFWGDRVGGVEDKHGDMWWMATRIEELTQEEINQRAAEAMKSPGNNSDK